jgi:hypothetical protein
LPGGQKLILAAQRLAIDFGDVAAAAPDQIRLEANDGIAAACLAALNAFQQERIFPRPPFGIHTQLQESGNRRLQVGDMTGIDRLGLVLVIDACESREIRFDFAHVTADQAPIAASAR